jgi:hypothetical protein
MDRVSGGWVSLAFLWSPTGGRGGGGEGEDMECSPEGNITRNLEDGGNKFKVRHYSTWLLISPWLSRPYSSLSPPEYSNSKIGPRCFLHTSLRLQGIYAPQARKISLNCKTSLMKDSNSSRANSTVEQHIKVWWLNVTFFNLFVFYQFRHTVQCITYKSQSLRPTPISSLLLLRKGISPEVPSRESYPGLPYSKPTQYYFSYSTPYICNCCS